MFHSANNSLQYLTIWRYPNFKTLSDCLYNLTGLEIRECKNLELLPYQRQKLTSLTSLEIFNCENINAPLAQWGLTRLTSLKHLSIGGIFLNTTSFSDNHHLNLLPTTLTSLFISRFQNLESLASLSLQTLTSFEELRISDCPKLQSILPREEPLPATLSQLYLRNCPVLKQRCSKEKGEDWPKIAHIPYVEIN